MAGVLPLSFQTIQAWQEAMDIGELEPIEIQALMILDAAMLNASADADEDGKPEEISKEKKAAWPPKKKES